MMLDKTKVSNDAIYYADVLTIALTNVVEVVSILTTFILNLSNILCQIALRFLWSKLFRGETSMQIFYII
jgi:hypothetical protein